MSDQKPTWEMSYDEIWKAWNAKNNFGSKGELTPQEALAVHKKWMTLGKMAKTGIL